MLRGEIKGRFDPVFYKGYLFEILKNSKFPIKKIGSISIKMKSGFGAGKQDQTKNTNAIIQIRPTNINNFGLLKFDKNIYISEDKIPSKNHILEKNTVLFNNTNSQELVGKTGIITNNEVLTFSNHITAIKVDKAEILPQYLWLILNFYQKKKVFYSICTNWNNQSGVGIDLLKSIKIPVPPLSKQQVIVNLLETGVKEKQEKEKQAKELLSRIDDYLLDELDIKIPEKEEQNIFTITHLTAKGKRLDPYYYQGYFEKLKENIKNGEFKATKFKEITSKITDGTHFTPKYVDEGVPFISVKNVRNLEILLTDIKYITEQEHEKLIKRCNPEINDILLTKVGSIGRASVISEDLPEFSIFVSLALLKPDNTKINSQYLAIFCNSPIAKIQFERALKGIGVPDLHLESIKEIIIPVPPLEKQNKISEYITERRDKANKLQKEAKGNYENIKNEIEKMIINNTK